MRSLIVGAVVLAGALAIFACSGGGGSTGSTSSPVEQGQVTSTGGSNVSATISAATLGDDCGAASKPSGGFAAGDCNPEAKGGCGSICRASNVQIAFNASEGSGAAKIEILKVALVSAKDGSEVTELKPSAPQAWSTDGYKSWDQTITPKSELKASYTLSSPSWSTLDSAYQNYSAKFRLHVTVSIDGTTVVLQSQELSREPQAVT